MELMDLWEWRPEEAVMVTDWPRGHSRSQAHAGLHSQTFHQRTLILLHVCNIKQKVFRLGENICKYVKYKDPSEEDIIKLLLKHVYIHTYNM